MIRYTLMALAFVVATNASTQAGLINLRLETNVTEIASGDTFIASVFLVDSAASGGLIDTGKLSSGGTKLLLSGSSTASASTAGPSAVTLHPDFDPLSKFVIEDGGPFLDPPSEPGFSNFLEFSATTLPTDSISPIAGEIFLADIEIALTGPAGSFATFTSTKILDFIAFNAGPDSFFNPDQDYDSFIDTASNSVTVTILGGVVPEPASLAIWACVAGVVGLRRRRR